MLKTWKKAVSLVLVLALSFVVCVPTFAATAKNEIEDSNIKCSYNISVDNIKKMITAIQVKNWDEFTNLMCNDEQQYYKEYFADSSYINGVKQIKAIKLKSIFNVDINDARQDLLTQDYPILGKSDDVKTFIIGLDCNVKEENQYFYDGLNYFLIALANENGFMKVVQFNRPSYNLAENIIKSNISKEDKNYSSELSALNAIKKASMGLLVNANNKIITNGFKTIKVKNSNNQISANSFPILDDYSDYSYPSTINVKLNKTGKSRIACVDFDTYIKNVLPNEWYSSWDEESLKAGAYCVKMVGWYRTIKPVSSSGGYDVTQYTQYYKDGSTTTDTDNAVDDIDGCGMANSDDKLFFPEYRAGKKGHAGTKSSGILQQWGSQYLATNGDDYEDILNYYYKGSSYSNGSLVFFSY